MVTTTLHYIHDPLCGWCYGAAPLVRAARALLPVKAHGGGMMAGPARRPVTEDLRSFVLPHDRRIAQLTGQAFGDAYANGLLRDSAAVLDSEPPIAATLAAEALAGRGLDLLARLQAAHYVEGRRIAERPVLVALAIDIGLDGEDFDRSLGEVEGEAVRRHIVDTRALMQRLKVQGFPSFALQQGDAFSVVDIVPFLGNTARWVAWLRRRLPDQPAATAAPVVPEPSAAPFCGPDHCAR